MKYTLEVKTVGTRYFEIEAASPQEAFDLIMDSDGDGYLVDEEVQADFVDPLEFHDEKKNDFFIVWADRKYTVIPANLY